MSLRKAISELTIRLRVATTCAVRQSRPQCNLALLIFRRNADTSTSTPEVYPGKSTSLNTVQGSNTVWTQSSEGDFEHGESRVA